MGLPFTAVTNAVTAAGDGIAALTCFGFVTVFMYIVRKRPSTAAAGTFKVLALYFGLGGLARLVHAADLYLPLGPIETTARTLVAITGVYALFTVLVGLPRFLRLKSADELQSMVTQLQATEQELRHTVRDLQNANQLRKAVEREMALIRSAVSAKNQKSVDDAVVRMESLLADLRAAVPVKYQNPPAGTAVVAKVEADIDTKDLRPLS